MQPRARASAAEVGAPTREPRAGRVAVLSPKRSGRVLLPLHDGRRPARPSVRAATRPLGARSSSLHCSRLPAAALSSGAPVSRPPPPAGVRCAWTSLVSWRAAHAPPPPRRRPDPLPLTDSLGYRSSVPVPLPPLSPLLPPLLSSVAGDPALGCPLSTAHGRHPPVPPPGAVPPLPPAAAPPLPPSRVHWWSYFTWVAVRPPTPFPPSPPPSSPALPGHARIDGVPGGGGGGGAVDAAAHGGWGSRRRASHPTPRPPAFPCPRPYPWRPGGCRLWRRHGGEGACRR